MKKRIAALLLCLLAITPLTACGTRAAGAQNDKIKVSVTFDAMKEFAQAVGGNKVQISTIIPDGTEPHDFEPKAHDLAALSTAHLFVYNGLNMEKWADQAVSAAGNKNLVVVEASKGATPIVDATGTEKGDDPHLWISLKGAELETKNIRDGLDKADPADKAYFDSNCNTFVAQLEVLYHQYAPVFQAAKNKSFVTGHAAFAYLCRDFGLTQNSVEDVFADGEPSPQKLSQLIGYCKANKVKTIFAENMVSPAVSQTLANEVGAKVETIYTIESTEGGKSYLDRMKTNLEEIKGSLAQ